MGGWRYPQRKGCLCISWVYSMSENCLCLSVSLVTSPNYPLQFYAKWVCVLMCTSARAFVCAFLHKFAQETFFFYLLCLYLPSLYFVKIFLCWGSVKTARYLLLCACFFKFLSYFCKHSCFTFSSSFSFLEMLRFLGFFQSFYEIKGEQGTRTFDCFIFWISWKTWG